MPRRDRYHEAVRNALIKDGWTITHDPLITSFFGRDVYVDLGAETALGAEKGAEKIAVEIKVFRGQSDIADLEQALGQYRLYRFALGRNEPERVCYLAIPEDAYANLFVDAEAIEFIESENLRLIVYQPDKEAILKWIPKKSTETS